MACLFIGIGGIESLLVYWVGAGHLLGCTLPVYAPAAFWIEP